ncbi:hypothetical protein [Metabacillus arenae]|uniref:Uncharacterized protein n=1 Tax=Metabacillus arenae TaxID=2771434 RepID=A0A926RVR0_9BACI|nr:hypothetical protein [Metabacillus arenae]MBD1379156.1 hypothetical protein [Metabacillus arenae]
MCYASKHLKELKKNLENIQNLKEELSKKQSQYDQLLSEKYHELEVKNFNAAEGYYLAKGLQAIVQERRIIKNELAKLNSLSNTLNIDQLLTKVEKSDKNICRLRNRNTTYIKNFSKESLSLVQ